MEVFCLYSSVLLGILIQEKYNYVKFYILLKLLLYCSYINQGGNNVLLVQSVEKPTIQDSFSVMIASK